MAEPFVLRNGARASSVEELWTVAARSPVDALYHLRAGHFGGWLADAGRPDLAAQAQAILDAGTPDGPAYRAFMAALRGEPAPKAPASRRDSLSALLDAAGRTPPAGRQALVDSFVARHGPFFPYRTISQATFVALNPWARSVEVAGDLPANCWGTPGLPLTRLPGTDFWFRTVPLPGDARVDYKIIVDGNWMLDPLNPQSIRGGMGENSQLFMPDWHGSRAYLPRPDVPPGRVLTVQNWYSHPLGNARDIGVYLPPGYTPGTRYPVLFVLDGFDYLHLGGLPAVLDNCLAAGTIAPLMAVLVPPVEREREYYGDRLPLLAQFLMTELAPWAQAQYGAAGEGARRGLLGVSFGGYASLRLGLDHPEHFTRCGGQSASLTPELVDAYAARPPRGQLLCVTAGTMCDTVRVTDRLAGVLERQAYAYRYIRSPEGHSWGLWRSQLEAVLGYLWPARAQGA